MLEEEAQEGLKKLSVEWVEEERPRWKSEH